MRKVLLLEKIHSASSKALRGGGWDVTVENRAFAPEELGKALKKVNALGIRSKTRVTAEALASAEKLECISCFCIGSDQVNMDACTERGIAVFNAPYSNTRSVTELVIGNLIMLMRGITDANMNMHQGIWKKSANNSNEVRGKILGIVGYGHIGSQVSILAEALGMEVLFHDIRDVLPLGKAHQTRSLRELLKSSDVVTVHVPDTPATRGMIGSSELRAMKKGALFINTSRGKVVKVDSLKDSLLAKHLRGAALDVFPAEPGSNGPGWDSPLKGLSNVILTPHIAGSTKEAQREIGFNGAQKVLRYFATGATIGSLNFPQLELPTLEGRHRLIHIHRNVPGMISEIGSALGKHRINIEGQHLETNEKLGYLVTDVDHALKSELIRDLESIPNTIRVRALK